jgi:exodeoxyribonuclease VII small subunit
MVGKEISGEKLTGFEEQISRLQQITESLERNEFSLEKSLQLYKEGVELARECRDGLEKARHLVKIYTEEGLSDFRNNEGNNEF